MPAYRITLSLDLGDAVPLVGELLKELNASLTTWGVSEQLGVRSKCLTATLTSDRELTKGEKTKVKEYILSVFAEMQPAWKVKVESFRRKSGNVQQQAA